jgi:hypothetical protein
MVILPFSEGCVSKIYAAFSAYIGIKPPILRFGLARCYAAIATCRDRSLGGCGWLGHLPRYAALPWECFGHVTQAFSMVHRPDFVFDDL